LEDYHSTDVSAWRSRLYLSALVSARPDKQNKRSDHESDNQHPNLPIESEKANFLNEKLHRSRPFIVQAKSFSLKNILFDYVG
jgi:hypothetical protein